MNSKEITGKKSSKTGNAGTRETTHQVSDKAHRYNDRPGRNHRHGNCINKLRFGQPVVFKYQSAVQERNNRQTTPKNKGTGF